MERQSKVNKPLILAACCSFAAAAAHLLCIVFGGDWYRFFGAGEEMATMAEQGHWYPTVVTLIISGILIVWALYALSGAGIIKRLPLLRIGLCAITSVYLLRGIGFIAITPFFPENGLTFWLVSSGICSIIGLLYAIGVKQRWATLSTTTG
ncbi:hypothetical protein [Veronia pacifica]|uniref:DUF2569 domain-containing protein n=1 Tax=Veronia pacifica TaxID=1080227 RepID=A0A1C3EPD9_9GAMM|nr:hypothetical protein [Veronia pacifica]ODA35072.1 hypothetical protein A8L45_05175 [Veronia pacifica]